MSGAVMSTPASPAPLGGPLDLARTYPDFVAPEPNESDAAGEVLDASAPRKAPRHRLLENRVYSRAGSNSTFCVEPAELVFTGGGETVKRVKVTNVSRAPQRLHMLQPTGGRFLCRFTGGIKRGAVMPGDSETLEVEFFDDGEKGAVEDMVRLHTTGENVAVPLLAHPGCVPASRMVLLPTRVDFGQVAPACTSRRTFRITTGAAMDVAFTLVPIVHAPEFTVWPTRGIIPGADAGVDAGAQPCDGPPCAEVCIEYSPKRMHTATMPLRVVLDHPGFEPYVVEISGNCAPGFTRSKLLGGTAAGDDDGSGAATAAASNLKSMRGETKRQTAPSKSSTTRTGTGHIRRTHQLGGSLRFDEAEAGDDLSATLRRASRGVGAGGGDAVTNAEAARRKEAVRAKLAARHAKPKPITTRRPRARARTPERTVRGVRVSSDVDGGHGRVAAVLVHKEGKLRLRDVRGEVRRQRALREEQRRRASTATIVASGERRSAQDEHAWMHDTLMADSLKEMLFEAAFADAVERQKNAELRTGVAIGEDPMTEGSIAAEKEARRVAMAALDRAQAELDLTRLDPELETTGACHMSERLAAAQAEAAAEAAAAAAAAATKAAQGTKVDVAGEDAPDGGANSQEAQGSSAGTAMPLSAAASGAMAAAAAATAAAAPFVPSWDPYSNDVWRMRKQSLERFVRAARTVIYRLRAAKRLAGIRAALSKAAEAGGDDEDNRAAAYIATDVMCLGETGARFIAAKPSELLASGRIHHFAWPLYRAENFRDKQPLPEGEHGVLDGFAPLALKVPLRYQSMGYAPEPLEPLHSFTPTMAGQPLLEGAAEEDAVSDMPRAVTKSADTTAVPADSVDKETAATGDGRGASASALDGAGEAVALVGTATPTTTGSLPARVYELRTEPDARLQPFPITNVSEGKLISPPTLVMQSPAKGAAGAAHGAGIPADSARAADSAFDTSLDEPVGCGSVRALAASGEPLTGTSWMARREQRRARPMMPPELMGGIDERDAMSEGGVEGVEDEEGKRAEEHARREIPNVVVTELAKLMAEAHSSEEASGAGGADGAADGEAATADTDSAAARFSATTPATRVREAADAQRLERRRVLLRRVSDAIEEFDAKVKDPRLKLA